VAAELRYGAAKKGSWRLAARVEGIVRLLDVLPFDAARRHAYGELRAGLERQGRLIGPYDPAHRGPGPDARLHLVTDNEREFSRVDGLLYENWLR
jgi:tRNA(fMet)-specific endonuclease VapC